MPVPRPHAVFLILPVAACLLAAALAVSPLGAQDAGPSGGTAAQGAIAGEPLPGAGPSGPSPEGIPGDEMLLFAEEELVSASSRKVSKLSEAPGTITVLSRRRLEELGVVTLGDAIQYITSVFFFPGNVAAATEFRDVQQPFNNKILLLQDGRIVNAVYRGNFFLDLGQPIDNVEQIEIVRGPGSALYGANAFAGFINIVTRKGARIGGAEVRAGIGSDGLGLLSGTAGGTAREGRLEWSATARGAVDDGPDIVNPGAPNGDHENWNAEGRVGGEKWFAAAGVSRLSAGVPGTFSAPTPHDSLDELRAYADGFRRWETSRTTRMSVRAYWNEARNEYRFRYTDIGTCTNPVDGSVSAFCDLTSAFRNSQVFYLVDAAGNQMTPSELADAGLTTRELFEKSEAGDPESWIYRDVYDRYLSGTLPQRTEVQDSDERSALAEYQFDWKTGSRHYLLAGASFQYSSLDNTSVGDHTFRNWAAFVEDEVRFFRNRLILLTSLRYDQHSFFGGGLSPRASLIYVPNRRYTLKTSWGNAYRSPNFVELFGESRIGLTVQRGNPDLDHEQIETIELQFEVEPSRRLRTALTLYRYEIQDEVVFLADVDKVLVFQERPPLPFPPGVLLWDPSLAEVSVSSTFLNANGSEGKGLELEVWSEPRDGVRLWGSYSRRETTQVMDVALVPTGELRVVNNVLIEVLVQEPRTEWALTDQLNLGGNFSLRKDLFLDWRTRVIGRPGDSIFDREARFSHDLTVGWNRGPWSLRATAMNVTGADYLRDRRTGTIPDLDPRFLLLAGYRWEF